MTPPNDLVSGDTTIERDAAAIWKYENATVDESGEVVVPSTPQGKASSTSSQSFAPQQSEEPIIIVRPTTPVEEEAAIKRAMELDGTKLFPLPGTPERREQEAIERYSNLSFDDDAEDEPRRDESENSYTAPTLPPSIPLTSASTALAMQQTSSAPVSTPVAPIYQANRTPAPVPVTVVPAAPLNDPPAAAVPPPTAPVVAQEVLQAKPGLLSRIWSGIKSAAKVVDNFFAGFFGKKDTMQEFSPKEFDKLDAKGRGDRLASYADTNATLLNAAVKHIVKNKLSVHFPPDVTKMEKVLKVVKQHMDESPLGTSFYGMHSLFQNLEKGIKATPNPQQIATESIDRTATPPVPSM